MKRTHAFLVGIVILALSFSVVFTQAAPKKSPNTGEFLEVTYEFPAPQVTKSGEYHSIQMEGLDRFGKPGIPVLPYKTARILIPFDTEVTKIEVTPGEKITLPGSYVIEPGQQPVPIGYDGPAEFTHPIEEVYESSRPFPEKRYADSFTGCKQGYRFTLLNLYPIEYQPLDGVISYYPQITVRVYTTATSGRIQPSHYLSSRGRASAGKKGYLRPRGRLSTNETKIIKGLVDNPGLMNSYPLTEEPSTGEPSAGDPVNTTSGEGVSTLLAPGNYEYVIITNEALEESIKEFTFQDLINHKTARGTPATLVTTQWIYANYDGSRPSGGSDKQTKIRNFIIDAYNTWGTKYVLLGGDGDGANVGGESGNNIIPARGFTGMGIYGETFIPSDLYYGCLDGSFDYDGDGIYGEPTDGPGGGEVDLFAEVYVGRAPVDSDNEVSNFVKKTITYENTFKEDPSLEKALILGEDLGWTYWGCDYKEEVRDGSCIHGYCTTGFPGGWDITNLCDRDDPWDETDLIPLLNNGTHLLNHLGHANVGYNMKIYNADVDGLTNDQYFFAYSQGCYSGSFDNRTTSSSTYTDYDCIAEHLVAKANGAFAVVMNSRYGWGMLNSTDGPSQHFDREFFDAYFGEGIVNLGIINQDSKEDCAGYVSADPYGRWCCYQTNLLGDPQTPLGGTVGPAGAITLDEGAYPPGTSITIRVADSDLNTNPAAIEQYSNKIAITTDGGDEETSITLIETAPDSGVFTAIIVTEDASAGAEDGVLQIRCAETDGITVTYYDANDGSGNPATPSFTAYGDCIPPVITSVEATDIGYFDATITWDTNEPADSHVLYGTGPLPDLSGSSPLLTAAHSITLTGLSPDTNYYFAVESSDEAGNQTTDNNDNLYYAFSTPPCVIDPTVVSPSAAFGLVRNNQTVITVLIEICEAPVTGATVTVDFDSGEPSLTLLDDGVAPDEVADDGSYSAYWVPQISGDLTLTFTASVGGYDDASEQVSGTVALLVADFSVDRTYGAPPLIVQFSDLSEGDLGIDSWLWDFGDGETSTDQNPVHIYYGEAYYNVSLTVTYKTVNVTETKARYIQVLNDPPPTIYSITPNQGDNDSSTPVTIDGYCFLDTPHVSIYGGGPYSVGSCYCSPTDVFVSGDYAYVPNNNIYYPKLQVLDISDPANP
ncbi:MAG: PKD domain-containing protein, partial [Deltaproteobacteria bacterium]|nr:PKD domain-containing protein [Deltaproteobacteria bacterium]